MAEVSSEFLALLQHRKTLFGKYFVNHIYPLIQKDCNKRLASAMLYSLEAGGKKIRPILTLSAFLAGEYEKEPSKDAYLLGASCELIHTYSLIHDDLPAMDNDDLRRGIPTCHRQFDESTAILAGDALNSLGFYLVSRVMPREDDVPMIQDLYEILYSGAGAPGIVSGQSEDLEMEGKYGNPPEESLSEPAKTLERIHSRKTGALIRSALLLGNRLRKDHAQRFSLLVEYAEKLGLLYQITDDILDVEGDQKQIGKTPGKDFMKRKLTFVTLYGIEDARNIARNLVAELQLIARSIESEKEIFFKSLPVYLESRKS